MNSWRPNNCSNFPNPLAHSIDNRRLLIIPLLPLSASSLPFVGTRWHDTHTTAERLVREWAADVSHGSRKRNRWWVELSFSFTLSEIWTNNKTPPISFCWIFFLFNILHFCCWDKFFREKRLIDGKVIGWKKIFWFGSFDGDRLPLLRPLKCKSVKSKYFLLTIENLPIICTKSCKFSLYKLK